MLYNLNEVKMGLASLPEEHVIKNKDIKYHFYNLGMFEGPIVHLYTDEGLGIISHEDLDQEIEDIKIFNKDYDGEVYLFTVSVRFY